MRASLARFGLSAEWPSHAWRSQLDDLQRQFEDKEAALERAESWLSWLTGAGTSSPLSRCVPR